MIDACLLYFNSDRDIPGSGGNLTGINFFAGELAAKRLELLRELVPTATRIAMLVNLASVENEITVKSKRLLAPRGCKSKSSTPVQTARSMRPSQPL